MCDTLQKYDKQGLRVRRTPVIDNSCKLCSYIYLNISQQNFHGYILDCLPTTLNFINKYFHNFDIKKFEDNCEFVFKDNEIYCQDLIKSGNNFNESSKICCCKESYCTRKYFNLD